MKNKTAEEILRDLIEKHLEFKSGLETTSIQYYAEYGKVSGSMYLNVKRLCEEYASQQKPEIAWIKSSIKKPEFNVGVLVYIPEEDNHVTSGMWDISEKWVLLDEYRVPLSEVTYWAEIPIDIPSDQSYTPTTTTEEEENTSSIIRRLQIDLYNAQSELKTRIHQSQELSEKDKEIDRLRTALENASNHIKWCMENFHLAHTPDHFNIPANAIQEINKSLNK